MSRLLVQPQEAPPEFVVKALLEFAGRTSEGELVRAVAVPWFEIAKMIQQDPAKFPAEQEVERLAVSERPRTPQVPRRARGYLSLPLLSEPKDSPNHSAHQPDE
jgi:hypothetical protein